MRITIELDDGTSQILPEVTDAYVSVRFPEVLQNGEALANVMQTKSYSWGSDIREIVKEVRQSLVELEEQLAMQRAVQRGAKEHGDSSGV